MLAFSKPFTPLRPRVPARRVVVVLAGFVASLRPAVWTAVVASVALAGCAGAPVQEMSDTRQTIRAAEHAGAERAAPAQLAEAREGLRRAEDSLKVRDYRAARREAEGAHAKAVEALKVASTASPPQPR